MALCRKRQEVEADVQFAEFDMPIGNGTVKYLYDSFPKLAENHGSHLQHREQDPPCNKAFSPSSGFPNDNVDETVLTSQRENLRVPPNFNEKPNEISVMVKKSVGSAPNVFERAASERDMTSHSDRHWRSRKESVSSDGDNDNTSNLRVQDAIGLEQKDKTDLNEENINLGKIESPRLPSENYNEKLRMRGWGGDRFISMDLMNQGVSNGNQVQARGPVSDAETSIFETDLMESNLQATEPLQTPSNCTHFKTKPRLNRELQGKDHNLEALPALHKFQTQAVSSAPTPIPCEVSAGVGVKVQTIGDKMYEDAPTVGNSLDLNMKILMEMADKFGYEGSSLGFRGKCYERYRQKRDAKLRSEQATKKLENEARLKIMERVLEQAKVEITQKRYLSTRVETLSRGRKIGGEDTGGLYSEEAFNKQSRKVTFRNPAPDAVISPPSSKVLPKPKILSRTQSAVTTPPRAVSSCRRKSQSILAKNQLSSSVPNFTDLRKENTKPSPGRAGYGFYSIREKAPSTSSGQSNGKKNSGCELSPLAELKGWRSADSKNEKIWRSKVTRKSCASLHELKLPSPPSYEGVLTPLKLSKANKKTSSAEGKPFLRKGRGIGPGAGPGIAKIKVSPLKNYRNGEKVGNNCLYSSNGRDGVAEENDFGELRGMEASNMQCDSDTCRHDIDQEKIGLTKAAGCSGKHTTVSPLKTPSSVSGYGYNEAIPNLFPQTLEASDAGTAKHVLVNVPQSQKDSPRGFKRFLNFGRKARAFDTEEREEFFRKGRMLSYETGSEFGSVQSERVTVHSVRSSIPAPPANFQLREEHTCGRGSLQKAPRSCFSLSSFKTKEGDSKPRSAAISCVTIRSST